MIFRLWENVLDYVKGTPYWARLQPLVALLSIYLTAVVLHNILQQQAEGAAEILVLQSESEICGQEAQLVAAVIGLALIQEAMEWLVLEQPDHCIGDLDFAGDARRGRANQPKDFGLQDIAARNDVV